MNETALHTQEQEKLSEEQEVETEYISFAFVLFQRSGFHLLDFKSPDYIHAQLCSCNMP
jgi:hypothetical protein